jgi:hypothetical protein
MSDVATKLREARKLIKRGWTQGEWHRNGCVCSLSALHKTRAPQVADETLRRVIGHRSIIAWNDAPGRTQAEVLAAFDKAIELAESGK